MKKCVICSKEVQHRKKHYKLHHPEQYKKKYFSSTYIEQDKTEKKIRNHICPVAYLQNFAKLTERYIEKFDKNATRTYKKPTRNNYLIHTYDKLNANEYVYTSLENVAVVKGAYDKEVEIFNAKIEYKASIELKHIQTRTGLYSINIRPIYNLIMNQLVRTPKFFRKIKKDLEYLKNMNEEEYKYSIFRLMLQEKPTNINDNMVKKLQYEIIKKNILMNTLNWAEFIMVTNNSQYNFITSDAPVMFNQIDFIPSKIPKSIESSIILSEHAVIAYPLSPKYFILIKNLKQDRKEPLIRYHTISPFQSIDVLSINKLIYQFADRFIYTKNNEDKMTSQILDMCNGIINIDYMTHEITHLGLERSKNSKKLDR